MADPQQPRILTRRRVLICITLAVIVAGSLWWRRPAPLTTEERQLVGVWTLPMGPSPPANAVQQIYEFRSDRTLVTWGRRISSGETTSARRGHWRLEGDILIFERATADYWTRLARSLDGGRRPQRTTIDRMPWLDADADVFRVEGDDGSVITFQRLPEAP